VQIGATAFGRGRVIRFIREEHPLAYEAYEKLLADASEKPEPADTARGQGESTGDEVTDTPGPPVPTWQVPK